MSATRSAWATDAARGLAVVGTGSAVIAVTALPDPSRPVLVTAGLAIAACVVAAVLRRRLAGTVAVLATTVTVLLAGALDASQLRPVQLIAAVAGLLVLFAALAEAEDSRGRSPQSAVAVRRAPLAAVTRPLAALAAGTVVALVASQDVGSSVLLVLLGLGALVGALVLAVGAHRGGDRANGHRAGYRANGHGADGLANGTRVTENQESREPLP